MRKKTVFPALLGLIALVLVYGGPARCSTWEGKGPFGHEVWHNPVDCRDPADPCIRTAGQGEEDQGYGDEGDLEEQLKDLVRELKRLQKDVREKVRKEVLPQIKKEIEKLRKWLKEFRMEEEKGPIKT